MAFCVCCNHADVDHELGIGDCTEEDCTCDGYREAPIAIECGRHDCAHPFYDHGEGDPGRGPVPTVRVQLPRVPGAVMECWCCHDRSAHPEDGRCTEPGCRCPGFDPGYDQAEAPEPCGARRCGHDRVDHGLDGVCETDGCEEFKP